MVSRIYRNVLKNEEGADGQHWSVSITGVTSMVKALTVT